MLKLFECKFGLSKHKMKIDFLTLFNETNSTKNAETNEIVITSPLIVAEEGDYQIKSPCQISSTVNTQIKCDIIEIFSPSVSFSGITFETNIILDTSNEFTFKNCTIKSTKKQADSVISVNFSQKVLIEDCKIIESTDCVGITVNFSSIIKIINTEICNQANSLIVCANRSIATIINCNLHHSEGNGIFVDDEGDILIEKCQITNTKCPPIWINHAKCCVKDNVIVNCEQDSVCVYNSPNFMLENNEISNIGSSAISIRSEAKGVIKGNKIKNVKGNGIYIEFSDVEVVENIFDNIDFPSVAVINNSKAVLKENKITNIDKCSIAGRNAKHIEIINNEIDKSKECGISLSGTEKCIINGNKISNCLISAIETYNESNAEITDNKISNMGKYAFMSYTAGNIIAKNNQIDHVGESMAKLTHTGKGEFVDNVISDCKSQCENQTTGLYYFANNGEFEAVTNNKDKANDKVKFEQPIVSKNVVLCLKCNKNQRNCFLLKCGHQVYCKECAELALKNHENCPLCRFPIIQVSEGFKMNEDELCILCCEKKPDSIIMPCGHTGVCSDCLNNWFKENRCCPVCRAGDSYYNKIEKNI